MDLRLKREHMKYYSCVVNRSAEDAFSTDAVIPDSLPDAGEVVFLNGDFCLWRLDFSSGSAEAEGEWKGAVCYSSEETGALNSFPVSVGARLRILDDMLAPELKPYASFRVTEISGQLMNSRKVRIRLRVRMELQAYESNELELITGLEDHPEDIYTKTETHSCSIVSAVEEQVFTAADRIPIRMQPKRGIMSAHSEIIAEPPRRSGGRAVLRGNIQTNILYQSAEQDSLEYECVELPFSQLLDVPDGDDNELLLATLQLTSSEIRSTENAEVEAEFHVVAQTMCVNNAELSVLSDVYSVADQLVLETAELNLESWTLLEPINGAAETEITNMKEPLTAAAGTSLVREMKRTEEGECVQIRFSSLAADGEGKYTQLRAEVPYVLDAGCGDVVSSIYIGTPAIAQTGDRILIRADIQAQMMQIRKWTASQITTLSRGEHDTRTDSMPSVSLVRLHEGEDLWSIAKKYASSESAILAANHDRKVDNTNAFWLIPRIFVG